MLAAEKYLNPEILSLSIPLQISHSLQGVTLSILFSQFNAFAKILLKVVFPLPGPALNPIPVGIVSLIIIFFK